MSEPSIVVVFPRQAIIAVEIGAGQWFQFTPRQARVLAKSLVWYADMVENLKEFPIEFKVAL